MKRSKLFLTQGFTMIELVVVIAVLAILGTVVAFAYSGVQANNRDNQRQADIDALQSHLEVIHAQSDIYPTLSNLNDPQWLKDNLPDAKPEIFTDPSWSLASEGCVVDKKAALAAESAKSCYAYQVKATDGSACDNAGKPCAHYTLTAILENGDQYVKTSLN